MNAEVLIKFKADSTDADKKTKELDTSINALTKSFTLGSLAAKGITKAISIFTDGLDGAITRVDALNNFPKVMSNLGISASESSEVIQDLSEKLKGLPTTMDAAAMSVQRFTSKNGDVKESEKIFLAVNNAILAGGANATVQATALEQISQAYAKGKPDMMEWRAMMTAMPAQLKQVATAMGYTDAAMLGEAVRAKEGDKVFSKMIDTMVRMNSEGVAGFKSFDEQARNATGGISTSVTNMKTAFVRGIANILTSVNKALEPFGGLNAVISNIGKTGEKAFTSIGKVLEQIIPVLINVANWIGEHKELMTALAIIIGSVVAAFKTVKAVISIINAVKSAMLVLNAVMSMNPIILITGAIIGLVAAFIYLWKNCEGFRNFFIKMWNTIKKTVNNVVNAITGFFKNAVNNITSAWNNVLAFFSGLWESIKMIFSVVVEWVNTTIIQPLMNIVLPIVDFFQNLAIFLIAIIAMLLEAIYNIIKGIASWVYDHIIAPLMAIFNAFVDFIMTYIVNPVVGFFQGAWNAICEGANWLYNTVTTIFNNLKDFLFNNIINPVVDFFKNAFDRIWSAISNAIEKIKGAFNKVKETVVAVFNGIKGTITNAFNTLGDIIKAPVNGIIWAINQVLKAMNTLKVPDWVPGLGGKGVNFSQIPYLNVGTNYVPQDTLAMIHEGEAVVPKKFNPYANGVNASTLGSMQKGNTTPIINVYADFETDPIGQVVSRIKTFSGGAKNDYNYGQGVS